MVYASFKMPIRFWTLVHDGSETWSSQAVKHGLPVTAVKHGLPRQSREFKVNPRCLSSSQRRKQF